MLAGMTSVRADSFNNAFLLVGGTDNNEISDRILEFSTETGNWTQKALKLVYPRARALIIRQNKSLWIFGGGVADGEKIDESGVKKLDYGIPLNTYEQITSPFFTKA